MKPTKFKFKVVCYTQVLNTNNCNKKQKILCASNEPAQHGYQDLVPLPYPRELVDAFCNLDDDTLSNTCPGAFRCCKIVVPNEYSGSGTPHTDCWFGRTMWKNLLCCKKLLDMSML